MPLSGVTLTGHFISGEGHSFPPPARKDPIMLSRIIPSLLPAVWLATSAFADDKDFLLAREAWQQEDTVALAEASAKFRKLKDRALAALGGSGPAAGTAAR